MESHNHTSGTVVESLPHRYTERQIQEWNKQAEELRAEYIKMPEVAEALALLDRLSEEKTYLSYHTKDHTLDVIKETIFFALADNASPKTIRQEVIAAAWHDTGFIEKDEKNEPVGSRLFEESAAYRTLSPEERDNIVAEIGQTAIILSNGGEPSLHTASVNLEPNLKAGYMLDGDVSNFGRDDFREKLGLVEEEQAAINRLNPHGMVKTRIEFYRSTLALMENHDWVTDSARALRSAKKEENTRWLKEEIRRLPGEQEAEAA